MDTFDSIARANPEYVEALYRRSRQDPRSVDESWALVFAGYDFALSGGPGSRASASGQPTVATSSTPTASWAISSPTWIRSIARSAAIRSSS